MLMDKDGLLHSIIICERTGNNAALVRLCVPEERLQPALKKFCLPTDVGCLENYFNGGIYFFTFVLTKKDGRPLYCASLMCKIQYDMAKSYTIFSTRCNYSFLREILYDIHIVATETSIPLDAYMRNIVCNTRKLKQRSVISFKLYTRELTLRTGTVDGPMADGSKVIPLARAMHLTQLISIVARLLLEQNIVVVSKDISRLNPFIQEVCTLIFPLIWTHTCIPLLMEDNLRDFLHAPFPFLIGTCRLPHFDFLSENITIINLDDNSLKSGIEIPPLPSFLVQSLKKRLNTYALHWPSSSSGSGIESGWTERTKFQSCFLHLVAELIILAEELHTPSKSCIIDSMKEKLFPQKRLPFIKNFMETQLFRTYCVAKEASPTELRRFDPVCIIRQVMTEQALNRTLFARQTVNEEKFQRVMKAFFQHLHIGVDSLSVMLH